MPACSERRGSECSLCYSNSIVCSSVVAFVAPCHPDVCIVPFMCRLLRNGKETMAGIVLQRHNAISVPLSATQRDCDAFGFHRVAVHELERLRSAEQSAAYQRVANAAEKKLAIKRARCAATGECCVNHCCSLPRDAGLHFARDVASINNVALNGIEFPGTPCFSRCTTTGHTTSPC